MSASFFSEIPSFAEFEECFESKHYRKIPSDWVLYLTDVRGSTKAIERGAYQEVNMIGAACITAAIHAAKAIAIPYVFGGDGATLAVPPELDEAVANALVRVAKLSQAQFGLELRVGRVPISVLNEKGFEIEVSKYQLAGIDFLAMFRGEGMSEAESWVKAQDGVYLLKPKPGESDPNLEGLSCRWEPLHSHAGKILSILVMARDTSHAREGFYKEIFLELTRILGSSRKKLNPIKLEALPSNRIPLSQVWIEFKSKFGQRSLFNVILKLMKTVVEVIGSFFIFKLDVPLAGFSKKNYLPSLVDRSDFRKYDGMLRMVVDASRKEIEKVHETLAALHSQGKIFYGIHESDTALMTCVMFSIEKNSHVHFIDGNDGGYAVAAKGLKAQMKES